jgi:hypothetical protein
MAAIFLVAYVLIVELGARLIAGVAAALVLVPRGIVWIAVSLEAGMNGWAIAERVAAAAVGTLKVPVVTVSLIALELVAAGALFALRVLLRRDARQALEPKEMNQ